MLNSIAIQGRLVHTPEAKVTKSGKDVCTFSIACDRQSGGQKETDFFNCTAWKFSFYNLQSLFPALDEMGFWTFYHFKEQR